MLLDMPKLHTSHFSDLNTIVGTTVVELVPFIRRGVAQKNTREQMNERTNEQKHRSCELYVRWENRLKFHILRYNN